MSKMYTNPKLTEYQMDEIFVKNLVRDRKSAERREVRKAVKSVMLAAVVLIVCWVVATICGG